MAKYFRFEDLDIWKEAIQISIILLDIADELEEKKLWRFTDQLRGVGMSIPNNISESTGSNLVNDQRKSLRTAKKEGFEAANILVILEIRNLISKELKVSLFSRLSILCRRIQTYSDSLGR